MTAADLYNERILALARSHQGAGTLEPPRLRVSLDNPLCGDRITLDVRLEHGRIAALAHQTRGCLLTEAAAALLATLASGATAEEAVALRDAVAGLLRGAGSTPLPPGLEVFQPVAAVKSRHDCVLLPFDALVEAVRAASAS
jgi:nitrogen fixation NifU-like protein